MYARFRTANKNLGIFRDIIVDRLPTDLRMKFLHLHWNTHLLNGFKNGTYFLDKMNAEAA